MKKCFSRYRLALFALSLVFSNVLAEKVWKGTFSENVIDEDLVIKGDVSLQSGATFIKAINRDVTITLSGRATISGHSTGESQLYLIAHEGRTIRFEVDHDFLFTGSSHFNGSDLLIVQSGPGIVDFAIAEGRKLSFSSQTEGSGGAQYYVLMYGGSDVHCGRRHCHDEYSRGHCDEYAGDLFRDEYCSDEYSSDEYCSDEYGSQGNGSYEKHENSRFRPTLNFINLESSRRSSQTNRYIIIGKRSKIGFLSYRKIDVAQDAGYIQFDPVMTGVGRMILEIKDGGAFIVAGQYAVCKRESEGITLSDIRPSIPAGSRAIWTIFNSQGNGVAAGLLVLNENEKMSELLIDPFLNQHAREDHSDHRGTFNGKRYGVVLGANGVLDIQADSYLDFVGLALNKSPEVAFSRCEGSQSSKLVKMRNPSALIVDGNLNPRAMDARIMFGERAALFLRSGIASDGEIRDENDPDPFTIDASHYTSGIGNIVFDVEGPLHVEGTIVDGEVTSKIELLSLEVVPSGGSLFVGSGETNFPLRTFNTEDGELLTYNCGAFLINNRMSLYYTALSHTDECHNVYSNNDLRSEPSYVGGETFKLLNSDVRPSIRFINSNLNVNADIALTGLDLVVPNFVDEFGVLRVNFSDFIFYSNGAAIDNGTGRQMILGTRIGSTAADGCSRIDGDAHLDIVNLEDATSSQINPLDPESNHILDFTSTFNDLSINNQIIDQSSDSIHTIYLGGNSNISIGTDADTTGFNINTNPWLRIAGNVFSFEARGGEATVSRSNITGRNAIFVDLNGKISIEPGFIANMGVMVIKSHNGIVDLPADQVFFSNGAGIATWDVNLANLDDQMIAGPDQSLSTYVFNWMLARKDFPNFLPFNCCVDACRCAEVTDANITSLPTIQGSVDNLQIQGTRIGDPAQFLIDGGNVRQLTFTNNGSSAEAPVAALVLRNNGRVGLNDSTTLGANGTTIIADGSGVVNINSDMVINNTCSLVRGPNFAACDIVELTSTMPRQILLKSSGTLDLTSFDNADQIVQIGGQLSLAVEPGATIITGLGTLRFADDAKLIFLPAADADSFFEAIPHGAHDPLLDPSATINAALPHNELASLTNFGQGLHNTDELRVRIAGSGTIELMDNAQALLPANAFVGIETINDPNCEITTTDINLSIADNASFEIGNLNANEGGSLQIGNVEDVEGHTVNFSLTLNGDGASFTIGSGGFVGFGVGIERFDGRNETVNPNTIFRANGCSINFSPNENIVNTLNNVGNVRMNLLNGVLRHDRIFSGDDSNASLLAISGANGSTFELQFERPNENVDPALERASNFNVIGGGNMVLVQPGVGGIHPIVLNTAGEITSRLTAGMMASSLLQPKNVDVAGLTGAQLFDYLATQDAQNVETTRDNSFGRANAAAQGDSFRPGFENIRLGTVVNDTILRTPAFDIIGAGQNDSKRRNALDTGAVFVNIFNDEIVTATNIGN